MIMYQGKLVYDEDSFDFSVVHVGDYVDSRVVENVVNCMPPAMMRDSCTQMGEPYSHLWDEQKQRLRPTFATFVRKTAEIWQYMGNCFLGETTERGIRKYSF